MKAAEPVWSRLWEIEIKLKGLAYLIESQGSDPAPPLPWDQEEINAGIGKLFWSLATDIAEVRRRVEEDHLRSARSDVGIHEKKSEVENE